MLRRCALTRYAAMPLHIYDSASYAARARRALMLICAMHSAAAAAADDALLYFRRCQLLSAF